MIMSSVHSRVSAAILAGGRATRYGGADKASLAVGGARIIDRQLAALSGVADDVRLVSSDLARYAGLGVPVVADAIDAAGPLGGIYTALVHASHAHTIVLACDLPFVTAELFERLVDAAEGVDAVVPRSAHGLEPLCAVYARAVADRLRQRIDGGTLAVMAALDDLRVRELGPEELGALDRDGRLFVNVNTPHDYARALGQD